MRMLASLLLAAVTTVSAAPPNYSDIWWNPLESGWGLTVADHQTQMFVVWYTYRQDGAPTWYVMPGGTFTEGKRLFTGDAYQTTGPAYTSATFNSASVTVTKAGTMSIDFAPPGLAAGTALFTYSIAGITRSKHVERQAFGNGAPNWGMDYTDIYFDPNESGWGLTMAQHGNQIFGVWYTYDATGQPLFVVMPGGTFSGTTSFAGDLYTTRGPWFGNATFDPAQVVATKIGSATLDLQAQSLGSTYKQSSARFTPRLSSGQTLVKSVQQQAFGYVAPDMATPAVNTSALCSYRNCSVMTTGYGYYGETMSSCSCTTDPAELSQACTAAKPRAEIGQSCVNKGCPEGSVCGQTTMGAMVCMAQTDFMDQCGY
jgi:hypothetical protein